MRGFRLLLAAALFLVSARAEAQFRGVRFEITTVGDTTFTFQSGRERWIKPGISGIAVDPAKHDALVARFRVMRVTRGEALAVITGQTTNIRTNHMVVMQEPRPPFYRTARFWSALLLGAAAGFVAGSSTN
jgi:hypothetical protein